MGYTHYWNYVPSRIKDTEVLRKKFKRASKQIKKFANFINGEKSFNICGGFGDGAPVFNETEIWFNGDGTESMDHETFRIYWSTDEKAFCKTAHKPYDLLVCFALLTFAEIFGKNVFSFSSDGDMEDEEWQRACEYYQDVTGKKPITESIN